ncbi:ankyrin [Cadophora sp. DSE1049]|nr:ankyrin [Cadophora sp. DSE1049]
MSSDPRHLALLEAVSRGNETELKNILSVQTSWLSTQDVNTLREALQTASANGSFGCVRLLLEYHAELEASGHDEISALFQAVQNRHKDIALELLARKADPNWQKNIYGESALFPACRHGLITVVKALLEAGADVNHCTPGWSTSTPFLECSRESFADDPDHEPRMEIAKLLAKNNADINATTRQGRTAALWAAINGNIPLLQLHVDGVLGTYTGLFREQLEREAMHMAAEKGHEDVVKFLLARRFNPDVASEQGWTALHYFAKQGKELAVDLLLSANADPNIRIEFSGMTPTHCAVMNSHKSTVEYLLKARDIDTTIKDRLGRTALMCAIDDSIAELLSPARIDTKTLSPTALLACQKTFAIIVSLSPDSSILETSRHPVDDVLYGWDPDEQGDLTVPKVPTVPEYGYGIKWIHLPANNMAWIQTLVPKAWIERDCERARSFGTTMNCLNEGTRKPLNHTNYLQPSCHLISGSKRKLADGDWHALLHENAEERERIFNLEDKEQEAIKLALFVPYLHYDTSDGYVKMRTAIRQASESSPSYPPTAMADSSDEMVVKGYLHDNLPLHPRRTLDQFFSADIETTEVDLGQAFLNHSRVSEPNGKIMVDQLWLLILHDDLVVTCFPERWGQPKGDALSIINRIIEDLRTSSGTPRGSAYDLATIITNRCVNAFEDTTGRGNFHVLQEFRTALSTLVTREKNRLRQFLEISERSKSRPGNPEQGRRHLGRTDLDTLDALLDIGEEAHMMAELKNIQEELGIVAGLTDLQAAVLRKFEGYINDAIHRISDKDFTFDDLALEGTNKVVRRPKDIFPQLEARRRDIERMESRAKGSYVSLGTLIEMEQMQGNALEAKFARDQAISASRLGKAILVFTIVTVIFLPVTFVATIFTINFQEWDDQLTIPFVFKYIFGIGLAVSVPLVVLALTVAYIDDDAKSAFAFARGMFVQSRNKANSQRQPRQHEQHAV